MATTRKSKTETTADAGFSFAAAAQTIQAVAELPKGARDTTPNPLEQAVKDAADQGARTLPVPNGERAKQAYQYLRRAATTANYSLQVRFTDPEDKSLTPEKAYDSDSEVWVYFNVSSEKKERAYAERKYNNADIREWASLGEDDKITKEIRQEYRKAHGFDVRKR